MNTRATDTLETDDVIQRLRLLFTQGMLTFIMIGGFIATIFALNRGGTTADTSNIMFLTVSIVSGVLLILVRNGQFTLLIMNGIVLMMGLATLVMGNDDYLILIGILVTLLLAAFIASRPIYLFIVVVIGLRVVVHVALKTNELAGTASGTRELTIIGIAVADIIPFFVAVTIRTFINTLQLTASRADRTVELLKATSTIGQVMSKLLDMNELLTRAVEVIRDRFGFYHVQIFLLDESRTQALLTASTGEIGQKLMARHHRIPINSASIIGRVIQAGEPIIARGTDIATAPIDSDIMPRTRSELALPIHDGDEIIGTLDVQSMRPNAFTAVEIEALQVMTGQLATAIRNARLFQAQELSVVENKRLFVEAETNLREIQRLNRQLTKQSWEDYLTANRSIAGVTLDGERFRPGADWSEKMREASQKRRVISEVNAEHESHIIAAPIELRGEVVGAIEIEAPGMAHVDDLQDIMQAVASRLAVSLDNARLFEETQEATAQEQRIGEIVSRYSSAATVDDLLQITLEGLHETLGADAASIRLGNLPAMSSNRAEDNGHPATSGENGDQ